MQKQGLELGCAVLDAYGIQRLCVQYFFEEETATSSVHIFIAVSLAFLPPLKLASELQCPNLKNVLLHWFYVKV